MANKQIDEFPPATSVLPEDVFHIKQGGIDKQIAASEVVAEGYRQFNTVADLQQASLAAGVMVTTKGYHVFGDDGGADYLIFDAADFQGTPDGFGDHLLPNGRIAALQVDQILSSPRYGAQGGTTDDTAVYQAIVDAGYAEVQIPKGIHNIGAITGSEEVAWYSYGATQLDGITELQIGGMQTGQIGQRKVTIKDAATAGEISLEQWYKNFNYTQGTPDAVVSVLHTANDVAAGSVESVKGIWAKFTSEATNGDGAAIYSTATRTANGGLLRGAQFAVSDTTPSANGKQDLIGLEIDIDTVGASNEDRLGVDIVAGKSTNSVGAAEVEAGVRIRAKDNNLSIASYKYGVISQSATVADFFSLSSTSAFGLVCIGPYTSAAIRIAENQQIAFNGASSRGIRYNSSNDSFEFIANGVVKHSFSMT